MCGIVGYIGTQNATPILLDGLRTLEYRGYDSAGLAVLDGAGTVQVRRAAGRLTNLAAAVDSEPVAGHVAIGHTRWATHGPPTRHNAHPHTSPDQHFVVVQNGMVENFRALRLRLEAAGYRFASDTDTEVIAHLLHLHYYNGSRQDPVNALQRTLGELRGPSAVAIISPLHPDLIFAARLGNAGGLVLGLTDDATLLASDIPALLPHTRRICFLEDGDLAVVERTAHKIEAAGRSVHRAQVTVTWDAAAAAKGDHDHFMQKEIFEQGQSLANTLRNRLDQSGGRVTLEELGQESATLDETALRRLEKVTIVACGTSYYAGLLGRYYLEEVAGIATEVDYASEFRYRPTLARPNQLVVAITQSGETVDTLAALETARAQQAHTLAIVNAVGSQAARVCHGALYMHAGPEIGVASTKAFTASITDLLLLALHLGQVRGTLAEDKRRALVAALAELPTCADRFLAEMRTDPRYPALAERFHTKRSFLYLGRGLGYPVAREGALKLKEISYIHAEGYPAGEMKHGPIALIDDAMPTVVVAPPDPLYDKMVSQMEQVRARGGTVLAVGAADDSYLHEKADAVLPIPAVHPLLAPILAVMPLQLFAYQMAVRRGLDVDQPRNLAKSVTVE